MGNPASLIKKNLEWLIAQGKTNPYELQRTTGVPQPTIHRILTGESNDPRTKTLEPLADFFKVTVADLRDRDLQVEYGHGLAPSTYKQVVVAEDGDRGVVHIKKVKLRLSAGIMGFQIEPEQYDGTTLTVPGEWIYRRGYDPAKLIAIRVKGESMEPTLYEDDLVIINTADTKLVDGQVYAVNYEGEAVIKRLSRDVGRWWLTSDNSDQRKYHRKSCEGNECIIVGRVVKRESERF
jgi:phage repressor protein C with HTH and peptisase S24 domain/DNA-binding Xre family transcriptional regulator